MHCFPTLSSEVAIALALFAVIGPIVMRQLGVL